MILQASLINSSNLCAHSSGFSTATIILSVNNDSYFFIFKPYDFFFFFALFHCLGRLVQC